MKNTGEMKNLLPIKKEQTGRGITASFAELYCSTSQFIERSVENDGPTPTQVFCLCTYQLAKIPKMSFQLLSCTYILPQLQNNDAASFQFDLGSSRPTIISSRVRCKFFSPIVDSEICVLILYFKVTNNSQNMNKESQSEF